VNAVVESQRTRIGASSQGRARGAAVIVASAGDAVTSRRTTTPSPPWDEFCAVRASVKSDLAMGRLKFRELASAEQWYSAVFT